MLLTGEDTLTKRQRTLNLHSLREKQKNQPSLWLAVGVAFDCASHTVYTIISRTGKLSIAEQSNLTN